METILDLVETIRAEDASVQRLFNRDDGTRLRGRQHNPRYLEYLAEAAQLCADVVQGRRGVHYLEEAMTTSDFPLLFGDILDRQLVQGYSEWPTTYQNYVRVRTVPDFRLVATHSVDGAEGQLEKVPEKTEYPAVNLGEARDTYRVEKYGKRLHFTWEDFVNDMLDGLGGLPNRLARGARRTEQKVVTGLYVDVSGPHASLYTAPNANIITGNPVLSLASLQLAWTILLAQRDEDSEPIHIDMVELVVPPALEIVANNIANALQVEMVEAGGTTNQKIIAKNWMAGRLRVNVDPYIPIVASTANGNTSWFLFANPNTGRPALELGKLRGHDQPALFIKQSDAQRVGGGGGGTGTIEGDFDTDSVQYKVRHVLGGTRLTSTKGFRSTVASNGSGS